MTDINETKKSMRDALGEALVELGAKNEKVVVLSADLTESLKGDAFAKMFERRFFQMGVAEQNMMGVASGLALSGKIPFVLSYAVFNPMRNYDQIRVSVCLARAGVKIIGGHGGLVTGEDGATHQALEDIALMRVLPNMTVLVPADYDQAKSMIMKSALVEGAVYIRLVRPVTERFSLEYGSVEIGKAQKMREGKDVSVFVCGYLGGVVLDVARELEGEIDVEVLNIHTIKPIDEKAIVLSASKTRKVITVEDHQIIGGLGGAVAEVLSEQCPTEIYRCGVRDFFGESGTPEQLLKKHGLDKEGIIKMIKRMHYGTKKQN